VRSPYENNAWAINEGQRLYTWFNCKGCHFAGGGGMGPALMDETWIYGSEPREIFQSIAAGRPNGMPAFGTRIPDQQIWELVAYVRSLSALTRKDVRPGRSDSMQVRPAPQSTTPARPTQLSGPPQGPPR
jgi:cytochrome c oxidase cbb3-type subunit 3